MVLAPEMPFCEVVANGVLNFQHSNTVWPSCVTMASNMRWEEFAVDADPSAVMDNISDVRVDTKRRQCIFMCNPDTQMYFSDIDIKLKSRVV